MVGCSSLIGGMLCRPGGGYRVPHADDGRRLELLEDREERLRRAMAGPAVQQQFGRQAWVEIRELAPVVEGCHEICKGLLARWRPARGPLGHDRLVFSGVAVVQRGELLQVPGTVYEALRVPEADVTRL